MRRDKFESAEEAIKKALADAAAEEAEEDEEALRQQTSWSDDEDNIPDIDVPTGPCHICGKETDWWDSSGDNLCYTCSELTGLEKLLVIHKKKHDEETSKKNSL
jgi:hypothetical protein